MTDPNLRQTRRQHLDDLLAGMAQRDQAGLEDPRCIQIWEGLQSRFAAVWEGLQPCFPDHPTDHWLSAKLPGEIVDRLDDDYLVDSLKSGTDFVYLAVGIGASAWKSLGRSDEDGLREQMQYMACLALVGWAVARRPPEPGDRRTMLYQILTELSDWSVSEDRDGGQGKETVANSAQAPPPSRGSKQQRWAGAFNEMMVLAESGLVPRIGMTTSQPPKRQHYIPQFWLSDFTDDGNADVLDVTGPRAVKKPRGITAIAAEDDYYTVTGPDGEPDYWVEHYLGWFDGEVSNPGRWENLQAGEMVASDLDRLMVAQFLVVQMLRGPNYRQAMKTRAELMGHDIVAHGQSVGDIPDMEGSFSIEATPELLIPEMAKMAIDERLPRCLFGYRWCLYESPDETGWALPLEPVVGSNGAPPFLAPVIYVPVNRRYLLSLTQDYSDEMPAERQKAEPMLDKAAERIRLEIIAHTQQQHLARSRRLIVHPADAGAWTGWCFK